MRLSSDDLLSDYFDVYLNGVKLTECIMADEEKGLCQMHSQVKSGGFNRCEFKTLKGKVELRPKLVLTRFLKRLVKIK